MLSKLSPLTIVRNTIILGCLVKTHSVSNIFIWDTKSIYLTRNPLHRCKQSKPVLNNLNYSSTDSTFGSALNVVKKEHLRKLLLSIDLFELAHLGIHPYWYSSPLWGAVCKKNDLA